MTMDDLADVASEKMEEAFEMFCGIRLEWERWVITQRKIKEEIIKPNMMFAITPQNVLSVPKVISLLGKMGVMIALLPKENSGQCM